MPVSLALYQPDIPQNVGALLRLGACLGVPVHVIHPTGFAFSRDRLRRSGLDYLDSADLREHDSFEHFTNWRRAGHRRLVLLTTAGSLPLPAASFAENDMIMVGRESAGVPDAVAADADICLRVPMRPGMRSLNVALAATLVLGEAMRQLGAYGKLT